MNFFRQNTPQISHRNIPTIVVFLFLVLLLMPVFVSALEWDNVKSVEGNKVTITDWLGIGGKLMEVERVSNTDVCLTECSTVWNVTIYDNEDTFLDVIDFIGADGELKSITHKFEYVSGYEKVHIPEMKWVCEKIVAPKDNNTESCSYKDTGGYDVNQPIWNKFEPIAKVIPGNYMIKLTANKQWNQDLDWQPTFMGQKITSWTWWHTGEPVGYWKLNEVADGGIWNATDSSVYNQPANNTNGFIYTAGKLNNAANSSAGNAYMIIGDDPRYRLTGSFTAAMWINLEAGLAQRAYLGAVTTWFNPGSWLIHISDLGILRAYFADTSSGDCRLDVAGLVDQGWHRIVVTEDDTTSTDNLKIYLDGNLNQTISCNAAYNFGSTGYPLQIGVSGDFGGSNYEYIDDVQLWNITWSDADVTEDWNAGAGKELDLPLVVSENISINYTTYNANAFELSTEQFEVNVSYNESWTTITGILNYNDTDYVMEKIVDVGDSAVFNRSINITTGGYTTSFFYNFTLTNSTDTTTEWFDSYTQNVLLLNYTTTISTTFNESTFELSTEGFEINVSYNESFTTITGMLNYNATNYNLTKTLDDGHYALFDTSILIPEGVINNTFYFNFTLDTLLGTRYSDTYGTAEEQNVSEILLTNITSTIFNESTYEFKSEGFEINVSYNEIFESITALMNYNETYYNMTKTADSGNYAVFSTSITIPQGNVTNVFYFNFTLENVTIGTYYDDSNATFEMQNVSIVTLEQCGPGTMVALNFTAWNESDATQLTSFNFDGTFYYSWNNGASTNNISFNVSGVDSQAICISPVDLDLILDADINYYKTGFAERSYYLRSAVVNNITSDVYLYLLDNSLATSIIVNVEDIYLSDLKNHLVKVMRYYPGWGIYYLVEVSKTDAFGNAVIKAQEENVDYKFIIANSTGSQIYISTPMKIICTGTPCTLNFLTGELENILQTAVDAQNVEYSLDYSNDTGYVTLTFSDTSGLTQEMRLEVVNVTGYGTFTNCNNTLVASSGVISCYIGNTTGEYVARVYRTASPTSPFASIYISLSHAWETFGVEGLVWMFLFTIVVFFAGLAVSPVVAGIMILVSFVFMMATGLVYIPYLTLISVAAIVIIFIIKSRT